MVAHYTEFDKAVLLEKAIILNAMLVSTDKATKQKALSTWQELAPAFEEILGPMVNQTEPHEKEKPFF